MTTERSDSTFTVHTLRLFRLIVRGSAIATLSEQSVTINDFSGSESIELPLETIDDIRETHSWLWANLTISCLDGAEHTIPALAKGRCTAFATALRKRGVDLAEWLDGQLREHFARIEKSLSARHYLGFAEGEMLRHRAKLLTSQPLPAYIAAKLTPEAIPARHHLRVLANGDEFERARCEVNRRCVSITAAASAARLLRGWSARLAEQTASEILKIDDRLTDTLSGERYIRYGEGERLRQQIELVIPLVRPMIVRMQLSDSATAALGRIGSVSTAEEFEHARTEANRRFVSAAVASVVDAADVSFGITPTDEQAAAIAVDEESTLVLAGAGTGKTSVIAGKVAHLVRNCGVLPEEILVLAFNKNAAEEIRNRLGADLAADVRTFHAFGLSVIGEVSSAPKISRLAEDRLARGRAFDQILDDLTKSTDDADEVTHFAALYGQPYRSPFDFDNLSEYRSYVRSVELRTLSGERVKSHEELQIANFLALNGVAFEYEAPFQTNTADPRHRQYQPDFYLPDHDIYIEHFALDRNGDAPSHWPNYSGGVLWKRNLHRQCGTQLIETYSWQAQDGSLLSNLEQRLRDHGVKLERTTAERLLANLRSIIASWLAHLLETFLGLVKTAGLALNDLRERAAQSPHARRAAAFLDLFERVWDRYESLLDAQDAVDFDDLINRATDAIRSGQWMSPFRYVLVDEFQDISAGRLALLKSLGGAGVAYFLVGDDWQAINRFAGGDIGLMTSSGAQLGFTVRCQLRQTFRFGESIISPSSTFIQRNPEQTQRALKGKDEVSGDGLTIVTDVEQSDGAARALADIAARVSTQEDDVSVLVLGRYRRSLSEAKVKPPRRGIRVETSTVHSAKGREADYAVVLDLVDGFSGFPSVREDDPLLNLVLSGSSSFPHGEERRLFYVAMTRARRHVYLFTDPTRPSTFVRELRREHPELRQIGEFAEDTAPICPRCGGWLVVSQSKKTRRCTNYPFCEYQAPRCNDCGNGYLIVGNGQASCSNEACGSSAPACPRCKAGVLQRRQGRRGGFWGCSEYYAEPPCRYTRDA